MSIVNSIQIQAVLTLLIGNAINSKCSEISVEVDLLASTNQKTNHRILLLKDIFYAKKYHSNQK
ncbi:hypothetical protein ACA350_09140 [Orientia tsutsugamushi]|uniref:hypothetical protein n=1 Tax=Orientia tsutsugamushi TaxID=784 RepID=UPI003528B7BD